MSNEPNDLVVCVDSSGYEAALERRKLYALRCRMPMRRVEACSVSSMNPVRTIFIRQGTSTRSSCRLRCARRCFRLPDCAARAAALLSEHDGDRPAPRRTVTCRHSMYDDFHVVPELRQGVNGFRSETPRNWPRRIFDNSGCGTPRMSAALVCV